MWGPAPLRAFEQLVTDANALTARDPALASAMLADASQAAIVGSDPRRALAASRRARQLARRAGARALRLAEVHHAVVLLATGGRLPAKRSLWAGVDHLPMRYAADALDILFRGGIALYWSEDYEAARRLLERVVERARVTGASVTSSALDTLAAVHFRMGDWATADGLSAEALRIARDRGVTFDTASAATTLARIAAARGDETDCRALLEQAGKLAQKGSLSAAYAASAAGLLELSLGRADAAIRALEPLTTGPWKDLSPVVNQWLPELIEAYVRAGRANESVPLLATLDTAARAAQRPLIRALAARSRGLLAPAATIDLHFAAALRLHARTAVPFERARTELCYGERLRRARRRGEAITQLRSALATFERLGATPWAERARRELGPLRTARGKSELTLRLTPHELAVASLVGRGATNREAAGALFITTKTVEYHLAAIYRKLGIRSRTELAIALLGAEKAPAN